MTNYLTNKKNTKKIDLSQTVDICLKQGFKKRKIRNASIFEIFKIKNDTYLKIRAYSAKGVMRYVCNLKKIDSIKQEKTVLEKYENIVVLK